MRTEVDPDGVFVDIAERIKCECPLHVPAQHQRDPSKAPGQIRLWREKGTAAAESMRLHDARKSAAPRADEDVLELVVDATKR